jgi:hypothetical protein
VHLWQIGRASAIASRLPYLESHLLPKGSLPTTGSGSAAGLRPPKDITVLATYASLLARSDLSPALMREVAAAAREVHAPAGAMHRANAFPALRQLDFSSHPQALDALVNGLSNWERDVSFTVAQWIKRFVLVLVPMLLIAAWLSWLLPRWVEKRLERQLHFWYGELQYLESDLKLTVAGSLRARQLLRAHLHHVAEQTDAAQGR